MGWFAGLCACRVWALVERFLCDLEGNVTRFFSGSVGCRKLCRLESGYSALRSNVSCSRHLRGCRILLRQFAFRAPKANCRSAGANRQQSCTPWVGSQYLALAYRQDRNPGCFSGVVLTILGFSLHRLEHGARYNVTKRRVAAPQED